MGDFLTFTPREEDKPEEPYTAIGVRSHAKGTFHRPIEDPSKISMKKVYRPIENDLIVSITFAWEHAVAIVKKEDEIGYLSHRFPCYVVDEKLCRVGFLRQLIKTKRFKYSLEVISPGGAGRNRVMNKNKFLKIKVKMPSLKEQQVIEEILSCSDRELELLYRKKELKKLEKQGLMQKLLTEDVF